MAGPLKDHLEWLGKSGKIPTCKTSQTQQAGSLEPIFAKSEMAISYAWWCLWHLVVRLGKGCLTKPTLGSRHCWAPCRFYQALPNASLSLVPNGVEYAGQVE